MTYSPCIIPVLVYNKATINERKKEMRFKESFLYDAIAGFPVRQFKKGVYHALLVSPVIIFVITVGGIFGLMIDIIISQKEID